MQNLLRPAQRQEMQSEKQALEQKLSNPYIEDKGAVVTQLRKLSHQLETQSPKPPEKNETDKMVRREQELREKILDGMPSQEEMRKNPPGAVSKHMSWEKKNKKNLAEWKNIRLRLNHDSEDNDIANFERYRPKTSTLNMDGAQIQGKQYFMPTQAYKKNYDQVFPKNEEPIPEVKVKKKRVWTEEQKKAASERMKALRAKKKEA